MKLALAVLLLAAPLAAQTPTNQNIVVNVVVTLVKIGGPSPSPTPNPITNPQPTPAPIVTPPPIINPAPTPAPEPPPTPGACVNNYASAVTSVIAASNDLVQAQQAYNQALSQKSISATTYAAGNQKLATVSLDQGDVRDLIRIGGPASTIGQNLTFVSAEIGTLPGLLGSTSALKQSVTTYTTAAQASLATASSLVAATTCPAVVP